MFPMQKGEFIFLNFLEAKKAAPHPVFIKQRSVQGQQQNSCAEHDGMVSVGIVSACVCPGSRRLAQLLGAGTTIQCPGTGRSWWCNILPLPPRSNPF